MRTSQMNDEQFAAFIADKPVAGGSLSLKAQLGMVAAGKDAYGNPLYVTEYAFNRFGAAKSADTLAAGLAIIAAEEAAVIVPHTS